ncbi:hypothetical protein [Brachybacterium sp. UMB0905]|uniref:hypothetical protein n=1 Tax=Brachybacterium sp. UMB0905 TaxID=2069310 RepID=UPI000C807317|nr:hypothetical protein [Brachybacterium sp. UMB0905]PMC75765.1 hypothetical protein CJ197_06085 [Brachybacterium sp. UMB0905]
MTTREPTPPGADDGRNVDAEFARMLEGEGLALRPGQAPREPVAPPHPADDDELWEWSAASPDQPPDPEARARARAAHPSAGTPVGPMGTAGIRGGAGPRELDDDEVLYGDFEPPDPDLPPPSSGALWAWTALLGGILLLVLATVTPALPRGLGLLGGAAAVGGVIALLARAPRTPRQDGDDGAQL